MTYRTLTSHSPRHVTGDTTIYIRTTGIPFLAIHPRPVIAPVAPHSAPAPRKAKQAHGQSREVLSTTLPPSSLTSPTQTTFWSTSGSDTMPTLQRVTTSLPFASFSLPTTRTLISTHSGRRVHQTSPRAARTWTQRRNSTNSTRTTLLLTKSAGLPMPTPRRTGVLRWTLAMASPFMLQDGHHRHSPTSPGDSSASSPRSSVPPRSPQPRSPSRSTSPANPASRGQSRQRGRSPTSGDNQPSRDGPAYPDTASSSSGHKRARTTAPTPAPSTSQTIAPPGHNLSLIHI